MTTRADLWRVLAERPALRGTLDDWRAELGASFDLARPLLRPAGGVAETWACGETGRVGCHRHVIDHGDEVVAVCGERPRQCGRVSLARADLVLYELDHRKLGHALLPRDLTIEGSPELTAAGWLLGRARVADQELLLHLSWDSTTGALLEARRMLSDRWGRCPAVFLVPLSERVDQGARAELGDRDAMVMPLDRAMRSASSLAVDLADAIVWFRLDDDDLGTTLAHRYDLVLDPMGDRYWLYGVRIAFKARARYPQRLLVALAKAPRALVTRLDLFAAVWPDDYGRKGVEKNWGRSLRDQVTALKAALDIDEERYPITARSAGDDAEGGYLLRIDPRRVLWWSEPIE